MKFLAFAFFAVSALAAPTSTAPSTGTCSSTTPACSSKQLSAFNAQLKTAVASTDAFVKRFQIYSSHQTYNTLATDLAAAYAARNQLVGFEANACAVQANLNAIAAALSRLDIAMQGLTVCIDKLVADLAVALGALNYTLVASLVSAVRSLLSLFGQYSANSVSLAALASRMQSQLETTLSAYFASAAQRIAGMNQATLKQFYTLLTSLQPISPANLLAQLTVDIGLVHSRLLSLGTAVLVKKAEFWFQ